MHDAGTVERAPGRRPVQLVDPSLADDRDATSSGEDSSQLGERVVADDHVVAARPEVNMHARHDTASRHAASTASATSATLRVPVSTATSAEAS